MRKPSVAAEMKKLGFVKEGLGGNITGWSITDGQVYVIVTDEHGEHAPTRRSETVLVGAYGIMVTERGGPLRSSGEAIWHETIRMGDFIDVIKAMIRKGVPLVGLQRRLDYKSRGWE